MATYASNTTIKIGANVNQFCVGSGGSFTYTVPTNNYLTISHYTIVSGGTLTINYPSTSEVETYTTPGTYPLTPHRTFGPGTVISGTTGTAERVEFNGYLMTNTP